MHWNVISAKYLDGYRLRITFADGKSGVVDFQKYVQRGGVFRRLADLDFFKAFVINQDFGVLSWGDSLDIAPETLYEAATQQPSPAAIGEAPAKYRARRRK
jgi:hypothetical protein